MMRKLFLIFVALLPSTLKVKLFKWVLGWDIHPSAKIGLCLLDVKHVEMGENSAIRNLTIIKGLDLLKMEACSTISKLNFITSFPTSIKGKHFASFPNRETTLHLKKNSAITSRHIIDCTDKIVIGEFSTVAGFRSQFLTHSIDLKQSIQSCSPIEIGDHCFIGTQCVLLPGSKLPNRSILTPGAVLNNNYLDEYCMYGGVPAKKIKSLEGQQYNYMTRDTGYVW